MINSHTITKHIKPMFIMGYCDTEPTSQEIKDLALLKGYNLVEDTLVINEVDKGWNFSAEITLT